MKTSKKAAAPIIAFFLSAILALALGIIVMNMNDYALEQENICLNSENVKLTSDDDGMKICVYNITGDSDLDTINFLYFSLENVAEVPVFGYHITMIGDLNKSQYVKRDYDIVVLPYKTLDKTYVVPENLGNIKQVKIGVYRKLGKELVFCPESQIVTSSIPICSEELFNKLI